MDFRYSSTVPRILPSPLDFVTSLAIVIVKNILVKRPQVIIVFKIIEPITPCSKSLC